MVPGIETGVPEYGDWVVAVGVGVDVGVGVGVVIVGVGVGVGVVTTPPYSYVPIS